MAERGAPDGVANSGEEATNAPAKSIGLDPAAEFRTLSRRLEEVADQVSRIQKPATFRIVDIVQLVALIAAFVVAGFTALGFKDRIDDLVKGQLATETRISTQISGAETRLSTRIDRIDDRVSKLGERTSAIEGGSLKGR